MTVVTNKQELCVMLSEIITEASFLTVKELTAGTTSVTDAVLQALTIADKALNKSCPNKTFNKYIETLEKIEFSYRIEYQRSLESKIDFSEEQFKKRLNSMDKQLLEKLKLETEKMVWLVCTAGDIFNGRPFHQTRDYWQSIGYTIDSALKNK